MFPWATNTGIFLGAVLNRIVDRSTLLKMRDSPECVLKKFLDGIKANALSKVNSALKVRGSIIALFKLINSIGNST